MKRKKCTGPNRSNPRARNSTIKRADGFQQYTPDEPEFVERVIAADFVQRDLSEGEGEVDSGGMLLEMSITSELGVPDLFGDMEYIDHDPSEFSVERFSNVGAVLINHDHNQRVGTPTDVRINEKLRRSEATVRFADNDAGRSAFAEATKHGTLRGVSGGFLVRNWIWLEEGETYKDRFEGPSWVGSGNELMEASLTPIPADPTVGIQRNEQRRNRNREEEIMKWNVTFLRAHGGHAEGAAVELEQADAEQLIADGVCTRDVRETEPAPESARTVTGEPQSKVDQGADVNPSHVSDMLAAERKRCATIRSIGEQHGINMQAFVDDGSSEADSQSFALGVLAERSLNRQTAPTGDLQVTQDGRESFLRAASYGLEMRSGGEFAKRARSDRDANKRQDNGGDNFTAYSLVRLAEECLRRASMPVPTTNTEIVSRALAGPAISSFDIETRAAENITVGTSDFPLILANVVNKAMLAGVDLAETTYRDWCRIGSGNDFKAMSRLKISEAGKLSEVPEFGTYPTTKFSEQREQITIKTYGEVYNLSRQAIINDDMSAFSEIPSALGRAAAILPNDLAVTILLANGNMSDAVALFAAGHNNLTAAAGNAFTSVANARTGISNLVTLLMQQTAFQHSDLTSEEMKLRLRPSILLIPPTGWEFPAAVLGGTSFGAGVEGVNPLNGIARAVMEPSLEDANITGNSTTAYYLFASPAQAPVIEVAFLNGNDSPFMEEIVNQGSAADGRVFKVRMDCVAGAVDWRGAQKENGA